MEPRRRLANMKVAQIKLSVKGCVIDMARRRRLAATKDVQNKFRRRDYAEDITIYRMV